MSLRTALLTGFLLFAALVPAAAQEPPAREPSETTLLEMREKAEAALAALAESREKASTLVGSTIEEKDVADWQEAITLRIEDLKSLESVLREREGIVGAGEKAAVQLKAAKADLNAALALKPEPLRGKPSQEMLLQGQAERDRLKLDVDSAERRLGDRKDALAKLEARLSSFPLEIAEKSRLVRDAEAEPPQGIDAYRIESHRFRIRYLENWQAMAPAKRLLLDDLLAIAETELKTAQAMYARKLDYLTRLGVVISQNNEYQKQALADAAKRLRAEAEVEGLDPEQVAELSRRADILELRSKVHGDHLVLEEVDRRILNEEAVNKGLREDLDWMKERFQEDRGVSTKTAVLLGNLLRRIRGIGEDLRDVGRPWLTDQQELYGSERADVSDRLRESSREQDVGEPDDSLQEALKERAKSIQAVVSRLRTVDTLYLARVGILEELEPLVINRIYRVRSDKPLDGEALAGLRAEVKRLARLYTSSPVYGGLVGAYREGTWRFVVFALGFLFLLGLGLWLVKKFGRYRTRWKYRGGSLLVTLQRLLMTVILSALAPLCLVLAAQLLGLLEVPEEFEVPGREILYGLAAILFVRRLIWGLFQEDGIAVTEFGAPPEVAEQFLRTSRWATLGLLCLALPWWTLGHLPVSLALVQLPRVLYTLMLAYFAIVLIGLLRRGGALVSSLTGRSGFWYQAWFFLWPLFSLGLLSIVLMDVLGYRYGARSLIGTVAQTLLAGFLIIGLYNLIQVLIERASKKVRRQLVEELGRSEARTEATEALNQVTRFASAAVVVVTLLLLARFWGVTATLESLLSSVRIATVDEAAGVKVTLWDAFGALVWIASAHFLIAHLPGLYRFVLFPRLGRIDVGTRFVILAVSRYLILIVAYSGAILTLHISFSSLGYIFAALSVGIGFGLQEVVSNFVSGLILFFERPVRVGDFVSVGDVLGTVNKINIRATEVVNLDRQVIIIPNREFITQQVTNWSHNDQYVRVTIDVGVSYSEDVGQVVKVLSEVLEQNKKVLSDPPAKVVFNGFGDSSLNFWLRPYVLIDDRVDVLDEINSEIMRRFREEGIAIPFPQRDLHLRSIDEGLRFQVGLDAGSPEEQAGPPGEDGRDEDQQHEGDQPPGA